MLRTARNKSKEELLRDAWWKQETGKIAKNIGVAAIHVTEALLMVVTKPKGVADEAGTDGLG